MDGGGMVVVSLTPFAAAREVWCYEPTHRQHQSRNAPADQMGLVSPKSPSQEQRGLSGLSFLSTGGNPSLDGTRPLVVLPRGARITPASARDALC
jgi:hypothetical protein